MGPPDRRFTFHGAHYQVTDAEPTLTPVQRPHPPIIIGGTGPIRTPRLAAQHADDYNAAFTSANMAGEHYRRVAAACAAMGRPVDTMTFSTLQTTCCGRTEREVARRVAAAGETPGRIALHGSPDQIVHQIGRFRAAGATRVYLRILDLHDHDHLELIAGKVLPQLT
ncbi:LLM class flavin-dependent oxidoreductase [Streptomyces sp. NPDC001982]|uniref:LLM class flavin-dependent oxidoreductase n=1 Tax=Streptomyces sp. NPDC001982 TaxID=3154405 RepID=UPI00332D20B4